MDDKYKIIERIGEGSFGVVYKCHDRVTNEIVALKKIRFVDLCEGIPSSVIREISLLKEMEHGNIIRLLDVLKKGNGVDLVFEYLEFDLKQFIHFYPDIVKHPHIIKRFLYQILSALSYCHTHKILHRDLKPQNLLVDRNGKIVKLADFGLARAFGVPLGTPTDEVATLGYIAPELLLGSTKYSTPIDVWAVGCIFAEMVIQKPLFRGMCESDILFEIFRVLGVPNEDMWPGVTRLCGYVSNIPMFPSDVKQKLADEVTGLEPAGLELLSRMLTLNPTTRIAAHEALNHAYFKDVQTVP